RWSSCSLMRAENSLQICHHNKPEMVEEQLLGSDNEDTDGHVVFICGKCKLPVGDSMSWDGSEDEQNQIRLKSVTENVKIGKESRLYEAGKESPCLVTDLFCRGCHTLLGMIYRSTPKNLDHKRFAFCFNVADIDSYMLGSASQTLAAEGPKEQLLTLEYRKTVEQELSKVSYRRCFSLFASSLPIFPCCEIKILHRLSSISLENSLQTITVSVFPDPSEDQSS
uniref:Protein Mis18-alpha n=1 Tax=Cynoglossus semilaevis TaxID=244447 RepID=A0A3P8X0U0_CYNSE